MESLDKHIKTRVKLEAFDTKLLTEACKSLIEGISSINGIAKGPIPLPTKKRIYCVLRSPHVDKKYCRFILKNRNISWCFNQIIVIKKIE